MEGAGAAELQLQITCTKAMADLYAASIADVILHLDLTYRLGLQPWTDSQTAAAAKLPAVALVRMTTNFPNQWYQALNPAAPGQPFTVNIPLTSDLIPYSGGKPVTISSLTVMAVWNTPGDTSNALNAFSATLGGKALGVQALPASGGLGQPAGTDTRYGVGLGLGAANATLTSDATTLSVTIDASKLPAAWTNGQVPAGIEGSLLGDLLVLLSSG
jgi:hypothetical protein